MKLLDHPDEFKTGIRVLLLVRRNKDGASNGPNFKEVSYSKAKFDDVVQKMLARVPDLTGYRLYASADERTLTPAQLDFSQRKTKADFSTDPLSFYRDIENHWISCLSGNAARKTKYFLFDIDNPCISVFGEVEQAVRDAHQEHWQKHVSNGVDDYFSPIVYRYATKSGYHLITLPFDPGKLPAEYSDLRKTNAMMLWGF
ncbi:MAG: hypothetical protein AB7U75_13905 [Hyphomicrobiaceae bacterium]